MSIEARNTPSHGPAGSSSTASSRAPIPDNAAGTDSSLNNTSGHSIMICMTGT
jgi:hypothetical protein